jgi:hypothetical protein
MYSCAYGKKNQRQYEEQNVAFEENEKASRYQKGDARFEEKVEEFRGLRIEVSGLILHARGSHRMEHGLQEGCAGM